jgi:heat shock 70kDa protein 4
MEALMDPFMREFSQCLKESLAKSGLSCDHVDYIELVGEGTRIPIIQECIKIVFGKKELSRTLNSQDCIARGCAL